MTESPLKNLDPALACSKPASVLAVIYSHLANESILVDRSSFLACARSGCLRPHLLHVLQHHITMPIESFHARKQFPVVAARDKDLCVRSYSRLEDRERTGSKLMFFELRNFVLANCRSVYILNRGFQQTYVSSLRGFASSSLMNR